MARWPRRPRSARAQSTIAATSVVAAALLVAGFAAVALQRRSLVAAIDTGLVVRVDDVSALIVDEVMPTGLAVSGDDNSLVQVLDGSGSVIASSANIGGEDPIARLNLTPGSELLTTQGLPIGDGQFRMLARSIVAHDQTFTIFAASSLEPVRKSGATLSAILAVGEPLLIAFVGVIVWLIVGRTLRPVEAIRAQVASIGDQQLDRRVPVPDVDDEIGRLAKTMNQMLERLEHAAHQQRSFVADASHELRSPLAAIRAQLEVSLTHSNLDDKVQGDAEALAEALRMQRLVDDLLLLARSDSNAPVGNVEGVDLDDIVFAEVAQARSGTDIMIDTSSVSGAQVIGNRDGLTRLVRNLLENAVRYAVTAVAVTVNEDQVDEVALIIEDDGPGIAAADRVRVFERFARVDEARDRDHGGAGLGLAIAQEVTRRHHGTIRIDESPLGGARLSVRLPASRDAAQNIIEGRPH